MWAHGPSGAVSGANNTADKGEFLRAKRMQSSTKIPGDFRSKEKEVVIFMGARFKLSHFGVTAPAALEPASLRALLSLRLFFLSWFNIN